MLKPCDIFSYCLVLLSMSDISAKLCCIATVVLRKGSFVQNKQIPCNFMYQVAEDCYSAG